MTYNWEVRAMEKTEDGLVRYRCTHNGEHVATDFLGKINHYILNVGGPNETWAEYSTNAKEPYSTATIAELREQERRLKTPG